MDVETSRAVDAPNTREPAAPSGWVTTGVAGKSLNLSPRTVRWHIERDNPGAKVEGEDIRRSWLVSIDGLQALRDFRQLAVHSPGEYRTEAEGADTAAASLGNAIHELADRLVEEASRAFEFRVRLELTERAESTLREELEGECRRWEEAERHAEDLKRLQEIQEPQHEAAEASEEPEPRSDAGALWRSQRAHDVRSGVRYLVDEQ